MDIGEAPVSELSRKEHQSTRSGAWVCDVVSVCVSPVPVNTGSRDGEANRLLTDAACILPSSSRFACPVLMWLYVQQRSPQGRKVETLGVDWRCFPGRSGKGRWRQERRRMRCKPVLPRERTECSLLAPSGVNGSGETVCVSPALPILQSSYWERESP